MDKSILSRYPKLVSIHQTMQNWWQRVTWVEACPSGSWFHPLSPLTPWAPVNIPILVLHGFSLKLEWDGPVLRILHWIMLFTEHHGVYFWPQENSFEKIFFMSWNPSQVASVLSDLLFQLDSVTSERTRAPEERSLEEAVQTVHQLPPYRPQGQKTGAFSLTTCSPRVWPLTSWFKTVAGA